MCSMSVLCPLCAHTSFESIDALRVSLIKAANGPLACPICHEAFLGLDKLTIHLFSHSDLMNPATTTTATTNNAATSSPPNGAARERKKKSKPQQQNEPKDPVQVEFKTVEVSGGTPPFACDLCEFTFSSAQLRDMHFRLVHRPSPQMAATDGMSHAEPNGDAAVKNVNSFKCHLCPKSFKSMGSLRVHMKVVHTSALAGVGGAEAGNARKFSLVDRMRKEGKAGATAPKGNRGQMQQQGRDDQQVQQFQQQVKQQVQHQLESQQLQKQQHQLHSQQLPSQELQSQQLQLQQQQLQSQQQPQQQQQLQLQQQQLQSQQQIQPQQQQHIQLQQQQQLQSQQHQQQSQHLQSQQQQPQTPQPPLHHQLLISSPTTSLSSNPSTTGSTFSIGSITLLQGAGDLLPGDGSAGNVLLLINTAPPLPPLAVPTDNETTTEASAASSATPKVLADNPKIWECDVCSKAFTTKYFLKKHKRLHTGEMPYTCEICSRTFTFQQSYHKHLLYHSDEKPHACTVCSRAFKELSTLQNHLRIHSGEKPFKCEVCGKCFRQRVSFLVHTRIHTGVMPYKCDVCGKSFRYKISQRNHKCVPKVAGDEVDTKDELMTENLLKAFLDQTSAQGSPSSEEIAAINASALTAAATKSQLSDEAMLSKAIDDIVVESCNKLGISSRDTMPLTPPPLGAGSETDDQQQHPQHLSPSAYDCNEGSNSPSQKFQNMRLYSPQLMGAGELDTMGGFPRFLLDDV